MSKQESLKTAMREVLETKGVIDHIKAELRAAIFQSLQDGVTQEGDTSSARPPVPPENLLINELIKEYLAFNGLEHSLAVFRAETRSGKDAAASVPHAVLATQLNLTGAPASVPLLYAMLHEVRASKDLS
ncbi:FGFR1 oncogene partner (FOP) [Trypanosoma melophagium]|uniref:FGFR1 oncogene partner (FOP) n=1 Tax=Trypanosoma melophagium TaxID=715481 RepID=UPI00351A8D6C|nr:FGFR1 oncogene partner (FOP) [Trypanosoma melophagium]